MTVRRELTIGDMDLLGADSAIASRDYFHSFRRYMNPNLVWGWWVERVALELQQFERDLMAGRRPKLVLLAPPQHGKSKAAEDLIAWLAGRHRT